MFILLQFGSGHVAKVPFHHEPPMRLFSFDLFRNFGIGFVVGAALLVGVNAERWGLLATPAQAAEMAQAPVAAAAEFVIAPENRETQSPQPQHPMTRR